MPDEKEKKPRRRSRRNYAKELQIIEDYCRVSIELLNDHLVPDTDPAFLNGQLAAFQKILNKLESRNGR